MGASNLGVNGKYLLSIMVSYAAHTRYSTLEYAVDNGKNVIVLPSHVLNFLYPLKVCFFSLFKLKVRVHTENGTRAKNNVYEFYNANVFLFALQEHHTLQKITSTFHKNWSLE